MFSIFLRLPLSVFEDGRDSLLFYIKILQKNESFSTLISLSLVYCLNILIILHSIYYLSITFFLVTWLSSKKILESGAFILSRT